MLILLSGQSNSNGHGSIDSAPTYLQGKLEDIHNEKNVWIWNIGNQQWEILDYPNNQQAADDDAHGQELQIGWKAAKDFNRDVYIVKLAEGSTSLGVEGSRQDWNPDSANELYDKFVNNIKTAVNKVSRDFQYKFHLFVQGERDSNFETLANNRLTNIKNYVNSIRSDLDYNDLYFIVLRLNENLPSSTFEYVTEVRNADTRITTYTDDNFVGKADWINGDDLTLYTDDIHYTSSSQNEIANRAIETYKGLTDY